MRASTPSPASAGEGRGEGRGEGLLLLLLSCFLVVTSSVAQAKVEYPPVVPGLELQFPRDEGSHPDFRIEWWYVTGWIDATDSKVRAPRGFQVTFFRVRTGLATENPSGFAPRQVLFAHAALADPAQGKLRHAQRSARVGFGLAYAHEGNLDVRLDDWSLRQSQPGRYVTIVHGEDFGLELTLEATQPPLLQGDGGFSRKGPSPRAASYYYSLPQLAVSGTITVDGRPQAVTGQAWFDHEWSSDYVDPQAQGWDWLGVNMHDGGALMAFRMHDAKGGERWASAKLRPRARLRQNPAHGPDQVEWTPLARRGVRRARVSSIRSAGACRWAIVACWSSRCWTMPNSIHGPRPASCTGKGRSGCWTKRAARNSAAAISNLPGTAASWISSGSGARASPGPLNGRGLPPRSGSRAPRESRGGTARFTASLARTGARRGCPRQVGDDEAASHLRPGCGARHGTRRKTAAVQRAVTCRRLCHDQALPTGWQ